MALSVVAVSAWGDAVNPNGPDWTNMPGDLAASLGTNTPYWDNLSGDGPQSSVGFFLTGTGDFTGDADYNPLQYLAQNNGAGNPDAPTSIGILRTTSSLSLTVIGNLTIDQSLVIGYYDADTLSVGAAAASEVPILGPGSLTGDVGSTIPLGIADGAFYGFYMTRCLVYSAGSNSTCLQTTTWFSNSAYDTTDAGHQHFSVFDSADPSILYIGVEDWLPGGYEGYGDFNDVVLELNSNPEESGAAAPAAMSAPEPATLTLLGAGLAGLFIARRRSLSRNPSSTQLP